MLNRLFRAYFTASAAEKWLQPGPRWQWTSGLGFVQRSCCFPSLAGLRRTDLAVGCGRECTPGDLVPVPCRDTSSCAMPCHAVLCHAVPNHAVPCPSSCAQDVGNDSRRLRSSAVTGEAVINGNEGER